jgi:hypothetical protein
MSDVSEEKELSRVTEQTVMPPERATAMETQGGSEQGLRRPWHLHHDKGTWFLREINQYGGAHTLSFGADRAAAEAELARWEANGRCRECGDVLNDHWIEPVKTHVLTQKLCHDCLHWTGYVNTKSNPRHFVVCGQHYVIEPDLPKNYRGFVGHGGAEFTVRFNDGREVVTRNLWAQGKVPQWFRDRLPDTAVFVARGHRNIGAFAGYGGAGSADADCVMEAK